VAIAREPAALTQFFIEIDTLFRRSFGSHYDISLAKKQILPVLLLGWFTLANSFDWFVRRSPKFSLKDFWAIQKGGVVDTQGNDPFSMRRPSSEGAAGSFASWSSGAYTYDGSGNITRIGTSSYTYDSVSRLTSGTLFSGEKPLRGC
jgi:hypothetical protein